MKTIVVVSVINETLIEESSKQDDRIESGKDDHNPVSSPQRQIENENSADARTTSNVRHKSHYSKAVHADDCATKIQEINSHLDSTLKEEQADQTVRCDQGK